MIVNIQGSALEESRYKLLGPEGPEAGQGPVNIAHQNQFHVTIFSSSAFARKPKLVSTVSVLQDSLQSTLDTDSLIKAGLPNIQTYFTLLITHRSSSVLIVPSFIYLKQTKIVVTVNDWQEAVYHMDMTVSERSPGNHTDIATYIMHFTALQHWTVFRRIS